MNDVCDDQDCYIDPSDFSTTSPIVRKSCSHLKDHTMAYLNGLRYITLAHKKLAPQPATVYSGDHICSKHFLLSDCQSITSLGKSFRIWRPQLYQFSILDSSNLLQDPEAHCHHYLLANLASQPRFWVGWNLSCQHNFLPVGSGMLSLAWSWRALLCVAHTATSSSKLDQSTKATFKLLQRGDS